MRDGKPILEDTGLPRWRVMIFDPTDAEILDTWYTTGLAGSGSNDYRVEDIFVPEEHSFDAFSTPRRPEPLYGYHGFFFANVPGVPFGQALADILALRDSFSIAVEPAMELLRVPGIRPARGMAVLSGSVACWRLSRAGRL
jgi:hypothetical protein